METGDQSKMRLYSLGMAAGNIEFGQRELEVIPIEHLSQLDGEINDMRGELTSTGKDREGNEYQTKQTTSHSIKATYLPGDANRPYPGLIRRGEKVEIYVIGDSDKYYWKEMGLDDTIRRQDIYLIAVPNSPKENEDSRTPDTAYYLEINTLDKNITIATNKNDGEEYAYTIQIDPKNCAVTIQDDAGQFLQLVSKMQRVIMGNAAGSEIKIEKSKALISTKDEIKFVTKNLIAEVTTATFKAKDFNVNANYSVQGGKYSVKASAEFTGSLKSNGINVSNTHYHTSTKPGTPTTQVSG